MDLIGRTEELLLLAVWRLQDDAYGVTIRNELHARTGAEWSLGSLYAPLHRLEQKGYVKTRYGAPEAKRGGRRTVLYALTPKGKQALLDVRAVQDALWSGLLVTRKV